MRGKEAGGPLGASRALIALSLALLCGGCVGVGTAVRAVMWHQDPSPFWIVFRDEGIRGPKGFDTDGSCLVVFSDHLLCDQRADISQLINGSEYVTSLWCLPFARQEGASTASTALHVYEPDMPDLSLPEAERRGPRVLNGEESAARLANGQFSFVLYGSRLGAAGFCPTIEVKATSLRVVLNAGVDRDLHVIVGEGTRECRFP